MAMLSGHGICNAQAFALPERLSTIQGFQENLLWDDGLSSVDAQPIAAVAYLFLQRLKSPSVWDHQKQRLLTLDELEQAYLGAFPVGASMQKADHIQHLFNNGAEWYRKPF